MRGLTIVHVQAHVQAHVRVHVQTHARAHARGPSTHQAWAWASLQGADASVECNSRVWRAAEAGGQVHAFSRRGTSQEGASTPWG